MQTTLTIPNKKADKYGKIQPSEVRDEESLEDDEGDFYQTAEEFCEELREAIHEVKEAIAGRKQLRTLGEFLDDYQSRTNR